MRAHSTLAALSGDGRDASSAGAHHAQARWTRVRLDPRLRTLRAGPSASPSGGGGSTSVGEATGNQIAVRLGLGFVRAEDQIVQAGLGDGRSPSGQNTRRGSVAPRSGKLPPLRSGIEFRKTVQAEDRLAEAGLGDGRHSQVRECARVDQIALSTPVREAALRQIQGRPSERRISL